MPDDDLPASLSSPSSYRPRSGRPVRFTPGLRRHWPRRLLIGVNLFVALCLVGTATVAGYVEWRLRQINTVDVAGLRANGNTPSSKPFTLLVVGSDTRALTGANNAQFGTEAQTPGQRSDTILLVRVVPADHQLSILSIPRDLWVSVQGMGQTRINAAFDSGTNLLVSTITNDLGIPIDHYVEVNFDTFRQITDAVGGVKFWFPTPAKDAYSLLDVPAAGCVTLTGNQALAFVRARHYEYYQNGEWHYEAESDLARIQRQQAFVKKMIRKAETEYTNPIALNGIIAGVTKNLTVDQGFSTSFIIGLAKELRSVNAAGIPSETLPTYPEVIGGADVLGLRQPQAQQMITAFNNLGVAAGSAGSAGSTSHGSTSPGAAVSGSRATVTPSSVSIEVANGSGVTGQAGAAVAALQSLGYHATVDPKPGSGFTRNVIRYAPDAEVSATQLQRQLVGGATLEQDASLTPTSYNLELITGSSYAGLSSAKTAAEVQAAGLVDLAAFTLASSTSTSSTGSVTPYVLPGTPPGQVPPATCNY
jgi:LCP family protein required for cell wall assembly